ncbi:glycosyltransferase family 4 protein [Microbacterium sp. YY-01]|uniref:glycosyltransferase family 4 protein n=1 Tax=Microbacterium sp. YY-01 TaxID=3421634 RepID=UPI003D16CA02
MRSFMRHMGQAAVIATRLYPPEVTAASFRMQAIAQALAESTSTGSASAEGSGVTVLTTRPPAEAGAVADPAGVTVRRARVLRDRSGAIRGYVQYMSFDIPLFFRLLATKTELSAVLVAEAPPTTGLVTLIAARLKRRRMVYYPGDVWTDGVIAMGAAQPVVAVMRWLETRVLRGADHVLSVSPEVTERLVALGARPERVHLVGNGVDTTVFHSRVAAAESAKPYFVYTGTMSEWQEPDIFIRALAQLHDDVELRFFGQGAVEEQLRKLAEQIAPGRVHFGGLVPPARSAEWIRGAVGALVSIVPGIGYDFARPTKTYAAAACGTPVLFTGPDTGAQVVREGDLGCAVEFTPDAVAQAMRELLEQFQNGHTEAHRERRASYIAAHHSLAAAGERGASVIRSLS